jgi:flagellar hook-associated protein 3 FlgL
MRISSLTTSQTLLRNLQNLDQQQFKLQKQAADGQKISNPSDDPTSLGRVLRLESEKREMVQLRRNADHAQAIVSAGYTALQQMKEIMDDVQQIAINNSSGFNPNTFLVDAGLLKQHLDAARVLANDSFNGDYLFGGAASDTLPYDETFQFTGDRETLSLAQTNLQVGKDTSLTPFLKVAATEEDDFFASFFNDIQDLISALEEGHAGYEDGDESVINNAVTQIRLLDTTMNSTADKLADNLGQLAGKEMRIQMSKAHDDEWFLQTENRISQEVDADLTEVIVRLNDSRNAYQAAMQTGADLFKLSLLQYI